MRGFLFFVLFLSVFLGMDLSVQGKQETVSSFVYSPDPQRTNLFIDSLKGLVIVDGPRDMGRWMAYMNDLAHEKQKLETLHQGISLQNGVLKTFRETWVIFIIGFLLLFLGIVRFLFPNDLSILIQSLYNDMTFNQISKEDNLLISWPSIFMFLFSGFSVGLVIYLVLQAGIWGRFMYKGFDDYLIISFIIMGLFALKIFCIRLLGLLFEVQKMLRPYIVVLYLSYFNSGLICLLGGVTLAFLPNNSIYWPIVSITGLVLVFLFYRVFKFLATLVYNYRFSKFYLFVYLCTLEIAPILILLKILFR